MTTAITKPIWGPIYWTYLHTQAKLYPNEPTVNERIAMNTFINILPKLLPCPMCTYHAQTYINNHSAEIWEVTSCRASLFVFFWAFHNAVNARLNKRIMPLLEASKLY